MTATFPESPRDHPGLKPKEATQDEQDDDTEGSEEPLHVYRF